MKHITGMCAKDGWVSMHEHEKAKRIYKLFLNETVGREGKWMDEISIKLYNIKTSSMISYRKKENTFLRSTENIVNFLICKSTERLKVNR